MLSVEEGCSCLLNASLSPEKKKLSTIHPDNSTTSAFKPDTFPQKNISLPIPERDQLIFSGLKACIRENRRKFSSFLDDKSSNESVIKIPISSQNRVTIKDDKRVDDRLSISEPKQHSIFSSSYDTSVNPSAFSWFARTSARDCPMPFSIASVIKQSNVSNQGATNLNNSFPSLVFPDAKLKAVFCPKESPSFKTPDKQIEKRWRLFPGDELVKCMGIGKENHKSISRILGNGVSTELQMDSDEPPSHQKAQNPMFGSILEKRKSSGNQTPCSVAIVGESLLTSCNTKGQLSLCKSLGSINIEFMQSPKLRTKQSFPMTTTPSISHSGVKRRRDMLHVMRRGLDHNNNAQPTAQRSRHE